MIYVYLIKDWGHTDKLAYATWYACLHSAMEQPVLTVT